MIERLFEVLFAIFIDLPYLLFSIAAIFIVGYGITGFFVYFPMSVWEHFSKKEIREDIKDKIGKVSTICISIVLFLVTIYQEVT